MLPAGIFCKIRPIKKIIGEAIKKELIAWLADKNKCGHASFVLQVEYFLSKQLINYPPIKELAQFLPATNKPIVWQVFYRQKQLSN